MVKFPEALLVNSQGVVLGYVTEVNDAYGHQVFCYDAQGQCLHSFSAKAAKERGWNNSYDVTKWFDQELGQ